MVRPVLNLGGEKSCQKFGTMKGLRRNRLCYEKPKPVSTTHIKKLQIIKAKPAIPLQSLPLPLNF